ncbi:MAG TPA: hypothetical protein VFE67_01660 [Rudaea sp.]|nr:hypothetical protein [Rudaea sp.]
MIKLSTGLPSALGRMLLAALALPGLGLAADHDNDDASARRQAVYEWYTDDYSHHGEPGFTNQKPMYFPAEYQRFLNAAAQRERQRYAPLLPGGDAAKSMVNSPQSALATGNWINIGPNNANFAQNGGTLNVTDSGRVNVVIVDPTDTDVIYLGFSGGGVWKSTDGGSNWAPKTETLGSLSVGTLEMDPSNSNTLYLGLGDPFDGTGIGLVKSTDGGDTWSDVVYLGDSSIIADIEVARSNPQIVLAATNTGLYRSTDGGASFAKVVVNPAQTVDPFVWTLAWGGGDTFVLGLEAAFANLGTGTTTDGQIWRSTDNGVTWTKSTGVTDASGVGRLYIASAPSNRNVMYAEAANQNAGLSASDLANVFKSTDNGVTWTGTARSTGTKYKTYTNKNSESSAISGLLNGQGWYNELVLVDPVNPDVAYFGGALLLAKTSDGGTSYSQVSNWLAQFKLPYVHADFHGGTIDANGKLYVGTDGGIFRSTNAGGAFTDVLNKGIASHLVYQVGSSTNNTNSAIVGLQDNGTRVRVGSTATFNQIIGGDGFGCDVNRADATKMLGSLYYDRIYKSTNSGTSFSASCSGITECNDSTNAPFHTMLSRWDGDATGNTLFTFSNAKAYKSTNYATSWTALGTTGLPAVGSIFIRGIGEAKSSVNTVGLVANSGRAFLTTNGGTSWTQIGSTASIPGNGLSMSWIAFDPTNASIIYLASVAPSLTANHLWRSIDSGTTWTPIDSAASGFPFGIPVNALVVDPATPTTLYAATHLGVYASVDSGSTWTRWGSGMPLVNVTDLYVANDDSLIRAATFGRSVWELSSAPTYTIGGSVTGLTTSGLVMAVTAGNQTKSVASGATSYVFPTAQPNGTGYTVSVQTQPTGQTCAVDNATGTIAAGNVTNANVTCTTNTYTVTPSVSGGNGTISPDTPQTVNYNATQAFTLTPDTGYHIVTPVGGTCGGLLSAGTYTTSAVTANCTVIASFAQTPDHLAISTVADGTAGMALGAFTVTVKDAANNTVIGDANSVTLTITAGPGSTFDAASTNTVAFTNGVATFNNVIIDKAGSGYTLKATDSGDTLNVTSNTFAISAAAASALKFTPAPNNITQGATLGDVTVTEYDAFDNVSTADSTTQVTLTAGSCGGTQLGSGALNAGSITFSTSTKFKTVAALVSLSATATPSTPSSANTTFNVGANADWMFWNDFESCTP